MNSFDPLHPLQGTAIEVLTSHPDLTTEELAAFLRRKKSLNVSLPNVYKLVSKLVEHKVIVKTQQRLRINTTWALGLRQLTEQMLYPTPDLAPLQIPFPEGERAAYKADSLLNLDIIWTHLMTEISSTEKDTSWWMYNPHPIHILGRTLTEHHMFSTLLGMGKEIHLLFGNASFLDHYGAEWLPPQIQKTFAIDAPLPRESYYVSILGAYTIEITIAEALNKQFEYFFQTVTQADEFNLELYQDLFRVKAPSVITVTCDRKKAQYLRDTLAECFVNNPHQG